MVMSLIESLTRIKNAVYGREVREAIHDGVFRANQISDGADAKADKTQIRQDAVEDFNNQVIQEMTDKDVMSAPEIIEARGGKDTLATRLNEDFEAVDEGFEAVDKELSDRGFNLDSLVGEDGVITTAMFNEAMSQAPNVIFLKRNRTYSMSTSILLNNRVTFEGNNAKIMVYDSDGFVANNGALEHIVPRIQNLTIEYVGSGKHRGITASRGWWGGRIRVDNVRIFNFPIGIIGLDAYHSTFKDVWITGSTIGMVITSNTQLSNMNDISQVDFRDCTYGMYLHNAESMRIFSTTFQECIHGLVLGDVRAQVEFDNCYFERNDYNTSLGTIDLETFAFSEYSTSVGGVFNAGASLKGSTVVLALSPPYFFGENHKFISRYGNFDTNRYEDNIENLLTSGIEYENIAQERPMFYKGASDVWDLTNRLASTPYGKKEVSKITDVTGESIRLISNVTKPVISGNAYLIKAKIWTPEVMNLSFSFFRDDAASFATGRGFQTVHKGWVEVTTMIRAGAVNVGSTQQLVISFPTMSGVSEIMATDIMIVDLTSIFSAGGEPGNYLSTAIGKYLTWLPPGQVAKTGYAKSDTKFLTTRPRHPKKGEMIFDDISKKPLWCLTESIIDSSGIISTAATWVDASGIVS